MSQLNPPQPSVSVTRILSIVIPAAVVGVAAYALASRSVTVARDDNAPNILSRMFTAESVPAVNQMALPDKDGDLLADAPEDPAKCIAPDSLVLSFIAGEEEGIEESKWKELIDKLKEKTGKDVKYVHFTSVNDQLAALKNGEVHIAGLNTGIVPTAVQLDGFVPICTFGREDGTYGYTMEFLVPSDSKIKKLDDIRGHKVMFTRLDSNSGFKAPLVLLMDQPYNMLPDRDYEWGFSQDHEVSINKIAAKEFEVAPVASDILARMKEQELIKDDQFKSIYTSERFPPATLGIVYNLTPELQTAIREALIGFELKGTGLEGEFGADATKLVAVNYKDDWANTRRIDQVVAQARNRK
ncbi:MAG: phosphate/phosphite/phosphonate ABC transporter substrate-binding protein [Pirellulales bacterium]